MQLGQHHAGNVMRGMNLHLVRDGSPLGNEGEGGTGEHVTGDLRFVFEMGAFDC